MNSASRVTGLLLSLALLGACDSGRSDQLENEIMLMQQRMVELESQVAESQEHAEQLTAAVAQLEAYITDVETEVIDLSMDVPRDLLVNVEATVGNVKTKLAEVRSRTAAIGNALEALP
jgi:septal ring factor EnvC (AmiA/AmiB activator)